CDAVREVSTDREAGNPRSKTGAKSVLKPRARASSPRIWPCIRQSLRSPVENTRSTEGAGAMTFLSRSTMPPSRSTHKNIGRELMACESRSSFQVCSGSSILRANKITPPACSVARVLRRVASISIPSKPRMRSWPTCRRRSVEVFLGIRVDYTEAAVIFDGRGENDPECATSVRWRKWESSHLFLQLVQQIQRFDWREVIEVCFLQPVNDLLR